MRLPILALAGAVLTGCAATGYDADRSAAIRSVFQAQIAAWNAAGVDPLQLDARQLLYASLACGTLTSLSTVVDPTAPTLPADLADWCALAVQAAAPSVAPMPEPRPEGALGD